MLEDLPTILLAKIASHLHWRDLIALEQVSWCLRWAMLGRKGAVTLNGEKHEQQQQTADGGGGWGGDNYVVWHSVGTRLIYHSLNAPSNLLSKSRCPFDVGGSKSVNNRQLEAIFERSGKDRLCTIDLALDRSMFGHRPRLQVRFTGTICHGLAGCTQLRTLDLSGIQLSGHLLVVIGRNCGRTLHTVRLMSCFRRHKVHSFLERAGPESIPTRMQFDEFLRLTPSLEEFNVAQCHLNEFEVLSFAAISAHLSTFICDHNLLPQQMLEVANKCGTTTLKCLMMVASDDYSSVQVHAIFAQLTRLEELLISSHGASNHRLFLTSTTRLQLKQLTLGLFVVNELLIDSFLAATTRTTHFYPKLECLKLRGEFGDDDNHPPPPSLPLLAANNNSKYARLAQMAPNLTLLYLHFSKTADDFALEQIAALGRLEELIVEYCPKVTWKGLAACVKKCPNLRILGQAEQMTDELLELVMDTMDRRRAGEGGTIELDQRLKMLFYFIRFPLISTRPNYQNGVEGLYNVGSVQSDSHNMHPWVAWRQERMDPPIDAMGEEMFNRCM